MVSPDLTIYDGDDDPCGARLQCIQERIDAKYAPLLATAGRLRGAFLRMRMRHELETELDKQARTIAFLLRK